ncbi:MAG: hypothetical protein A2152_03440 [Candidatus Levybacteria bacterium RBG_16_35_6]|nr:MAG: hypothetical protein A2152_03440 [Candidatus Levybacteria bacterium RBG_16_35_6]
MLIHKMKFSIFNFQFSNKKGFTLIELLIVIVIIGILATFLMSNFVGVRQRARDAQRKADLRQIQSALELYRADQDSYPTSVGDGACGGSFSEGSNSYMGKIPCDPLTGNAYWYSLNSGLYTLQACLENLNDTQKDDPNQNPPCDGTSNWSFTLQNP